MNLYFSAITNFTAFYSVQYHKKVNKTEILSVIML